MIQIPNDLLGSLLDYLRQQCAEREELWACNLLRHLEAIGDNNRIERR